MSNLPEILANETGEPRDRFEPGAKEYPELDELFTAASELPYIECEWCGHEVTHEEAKAVRPRDKAVMMCENCMPDPPEEWCKDD